jgi:hypothetical protein
MQEVKEHELTLHGLHDWYKKVFEIAGWMVLAKHYGKTEKIKCYKGAVSHLKGALENKIGKVEENDRKRDLTIMLENVKILEKHINLDNPQKGGKRKKSRKGKKGSRKSKK